MIAYLTGTVLEHEPKALIIMVQGVGYRVAVVSKVREKYPVGSSLSLRIYHHVTDSEETLFGFDTKEYLDTFYLLLTVPSVGPKTAMNILEVAPPEVLAQAVATEDKALLTKVSGVGKKTVQRLLIELKEKMPKPTRIAGPSGAVQQETIEALISLGYTPSQARQAVAKVPKTVKRVEDAVRLVLQSQGKGS